ncbi:carboxyl transferase domain-containing protein [Acuticoccus sp.]|uniref:acetyl-CoA carboxylase family protein n=1 Tax=Acuticoccus sp. TaxID=1904378 RepID=UPI003B51FA4B
MRTLLIANRGEVAIRIAQSAAELGMTTVAIHTKDDAGCLHVARCDMALALPGSGPAGYLDVEAVLAAAREAGAEAIHPGYGFLSENAGFARAVRDAGLTFVGPSAEVLERLGDKTAARALAEVEGVPINDGLSADADLDAIGAFMDRLGGPVVLKAVAGGGGRGMRVVSERAELASAYEDARREAMAAFAVPDVYVERFLPGARHVEVQVVGDGHDVATVWERDCSLQRRYQKLVEIAPCPALDPAVREGLFDASRRIAGAVGYQGLGTFEFLVAGDAFAFIEANPRLQVEHTVTEVVTGIDLVAAQLKIAAGASLADVGLTQDEVPAPRGFAVQARINLEEMQPDGSAYPTGGTLTAYDVPGGPGVRVDGHGAVGLTTSAAYDSLLAKVIGSAGTLPDALARTRRALRAFHIAGAATNIAYLDALLSLPEVANGTATTSLIAERAGELHAAAAARAASQPAPPDDPLGVPAYGRLTGAAGRDAVDDPGAVVAPMLGTVLSVEVAAGRTVARNAPLVVMEAMKMQHTIRAPHAGVVSRLSAQPGATVAAGELLAIIEATKDAEALDAVTEDLDLDRVRPDLAELEARRALLADDARPERVAKRHGLGKRMARENIADLCDEGSFVEYGDLVFAAQRARRDVDDLMRNTPADGLITGFGTVNADLFGAGKARTAVMSYDYTVLAGTQGIMNHIKKDRMIAVAARQRTPVVFFCEGGGGRPGDVDASDTSIAGLYYTTFYHYAQLSGLVPMVGIGSGRLFAGNAALLGCCDVVIATRDMSLGMGGPAMIEGGGLGVFRPEEVGPTDVQWPNGVIDVLVEDEAEAVAAAKRYLGYFQGPLTQWEAPDPRRARHAVPENRLEVYDVRRVLDTLADVGSVMELRSAFAPNLVTALARFGGRTVGVLANNPVRLSGAIDSPAADKAARFVQLCDAFDVPLLTLIDTPGMMVGPDVEATALVRHCCRLFLAGANATVPLMSVILRKAYGLGAQAMAGGSFRTPLFIVGWPTAEIGPMGLEGGVKLGYRKELEAIEDVDAQRAYFEAKVAESYQRGKGVSAASILEFDTVIDPAETRQWIIATLDAAPSPVPREGKKRAFVDSW